MHSSCELLSVHIPRDRAPSHVPMSCEQLEELHMTDEQRGGRHRPLFLPNYARRSFKRSLETTNPEVLGKRSKTPWIPQHRTGYEHSTDRFVPTSLVMPAVHHHSGSTSLYFPLVRGAIDHSKLRMDPGTQRQKTSAEPPSIHPASTSRHYLSHSF